MSEDVHVLGTYAKSDTLHKVGDQEYKVDHVKKVIYKKQYLSKHIPPNEAALHPEGHKWLDTNGDYATFVKKYPPTALINPVPVLQEPDKDVIGAAQQAPEAVYGSDNVVLPEELSGKKLKR